MKRKIFISINLLEKDKKRLVKATKKWQNLPVRWVKEQNLHITLAFLGHVSDDVLNETCEKVQATVENMEIFDIEFNKIELGPSEADPKTIWASGPANDELRLLQEKIEKSLGIFVASKKAFKPHITLGRIQAHKWRELPVKPNIAENFPLIITAESVDVMASEFENEGLEYTIIKSCLLK